ncbi:hypothetical protein M409DRAFT_66464 [Zasmidium cellare ATCC 36951]|uniref:FAD/NAD(P)-binding domain-containing protein n=1 Tax=Zasmidium cellare ATCC 36951 TaxID=1080233 RepID=A0A6A6CI54_ZASCE|nr:uncharacterized protein M409DRAFT_66464 [Zasmidium cellare ATCC 36951]KAF2166957.1 hypothetical protein M409DRAFT_66464 [Zasmidium cellare ATCC 36951]
MTDHQHHHDILITGAGLSGLSAAHTFLTIDPSLSLLILDSKPSLGGVWSTEQIYPGLRTNSVERFFEFSDYPILKAGVGVKPRCHIEGWQMRDYLEGFAERFGIRGFVRFGVDVVRAVEVEGGDGGWEVETRSGEERRRSCMRCKKLVLATGTHSAPYKPPIEGLSSFAGAVVHTHDLGRTARSLIDNTSIQNVTVIGAAKSAHDAVYMFARAGKHIDWILPSRGAVPMAKPSSKLGFWTIFVEAVLMFRPITWFGPAPWSDGDGFGWIRRFLHGTRLGNLLVGAYWKALHEQSLRESGIWESEKVRGLVPSETPMFYGTQLSALNYETNFYHLFLDESVSLVEGRLDFVSNGQVHMENGVVLDSDAMILATGYEPNACIPLEPASQNLSRGCPVDRSKYPGTIYPDLDTASDKQILQDFPLLAHSPSKPDRSPSFTSWRLWRFLAPPSQINQGSRGRNLVFSNAIASFQSCIKCELTSLWAYAYLFDRLTVPTPTEIDARREISLWTRFNRLRASLGMQGKQADLLLDGLPYYDILLRDLGLRSWRKGRGWIGEVFWGAYTARDYRGVVQEWMAMHCDGDKAGRTKML